MEAGLADLCPYKYSEPVEPCPVTPFLAKVLKDMLRCDETLESIVCGVDIQGPWYTVEMLPVRCDSIGLASLHAISKVTRKPISKRQTCCMTEVELGDICALS